MMMNADTDSPTLTMETAVNKTKNTVNLAAALNLYLYHMIFASGCKQIHDH